MRVTQEIPDFSGTVNIANDLIFLFTVRKLLFL